MARGGRTSSGQRDAFDSSLDPDQELLPSPTKISTPVSDFYAGMGLPAGVQDLRRFTPARSSFFGVFPQKTDGRQAKVKERQVSRFAFDDPQRVVRCARRKSRREVLFALRRRRKGSGARRRRRDAWSNIHC